MGSLVGYKAKNSPKGPKILCVALCISGSIHNVMSYGIQVLSDNISRLFFIFLKFQFFGLLGWSKGKKWPKMTKNYVPHSLSQEPHSIPHMTVVFSCKIMISPGVFICFFFLNTTL